MPKKAKSKIPRKPIPEDFELSDDEPTMINLSEEQKLTSKTICLIVRCATVNYSRGMKVKSILKV